MNPFDQANLSPLPIEPLASELPFGLTWDNLKPVLPDFDERESARAQAFTSHAKQGLNGGDNSVIYNLSYPIGSGRPRTLTIFIKRAVDLKYLESQKYQYLHSQGVAAPRLLATFVKAEGEVILLEFLPTIGIDFHSPDEVNGLLYLAAKLNSIQDPPPWLESSPGLPQAEMDELVRAALTELARDRAIRDVDAARWLDDYQVAQQANRSMPRALNHNQLYFQQVGWAQRDENRELVLFDLETLAVTARFNDIAGLLYPLSVYTGRGQSELFQTYLDRLSQLKHSEIAFDEAFRELRFLRIAEGCCSLPWLVDSATDPSARDMHEVLAITVKCMREDIESLGLV